MAATRYIMIGGFLGAGKTTAIARLAQALTAKNLRVGLITNDQGTGLVDTAMLRSRGFATEEIPGGCFCCRFNSLVQAATRLSAATIPDVFIAEPVGSCTDLVATVSYPLRRMYGHRFAVGPLSVLLDPVRALRIFELEGGGQFSTKVRYIYLKQIEEADLVVVNKVDTLSSERLSALRQAITDRFPGKEVLAVSARTGLWLSEWFERILNGAPRGGQAMQVDYETYAEGEALLGWLNATAQISGRSAWDGNQLLKELAETLRQRFSAAGAEVAHLKMTLSPEGGLESVAVVNLVRNDYVPELSLQLPAPIQAGQLIINARAELAPEAMHQAIVESVTEIFSHHPALEISLEHEEHFRPGKPQPTHRVAEL